MSSIWGVSGSHLLTLPRASYMENLIFFKNTLIKTHLFKQQTSPYTRKFWNKSIFFPN